jgi:hypothetical protein
MRMLCLRVPKLRNARNAPTRLCASGRRHKAGDCRIRGTPVGSVRNDHKRRLAGTMGTRGSECEVCRLRPRSTQKRTMSRRLPGSANLLVVALLALAGCRATEPRWQEEVTLSNGNVIVVTRHVHYEVGGGEWGRSSGRMAIGERLTFENPISGEEVTWTGHHRMASALDVIDGTVWIVARQRVCGPDDRGQRFWQAFALRANEWTPVPPNQAPPIALPNLVLDSANYDMTSHWRYLTISLKDDLNKASRIDSRLRQVRWQSEMDCEWARVDAQRLQLPEQRAGLRRPRRMSGRDAHAAPFRSAVRRMDARRGKAREQA